MIAALCCSFQLGAQSTEAIIAAFEKSYQEEAEQKYSAALTTMKSVSSPVNYAINLRTGWLAYMNGSYTDAVRFYQNAISVEPASIEARLGVVYPLAALEQWDDVLKEYKSILKIDPNHSVVNYRLGLMLYNRKDYGQARKYLAVVLDHYPFDYDANMLAGWTEYQLGERAKARAYFEKALMYNPGDQSALDGLKQIN